MTDSNDKPETQKTIDGVGTYPLSLKVAFDYPVHFARNVFAPDNALLAATLDRRNERRVHRAVVYVDSGLAAAQPELVGRISEYFHARGGRLELVAPPQVVGGGEQAKNGWDAVREIMWMLGNTHIDRQSYVIAVGGGGMLDMVGFAASMVHRGVRLVRMPSTTLAQCDGGVGVKNGMDEHGQKNFVGTFAPPFAVINDYDLLGTLSQDDWVSGVAEAVKVAAIKDAGFFDWLCEHATALAARDTTAMELAVHRCAILHLEHIRTSGDAFEQGTARPLDFGHWAAHKIETATGYDVSHGHAVAVGLAIDAHCAMQQGLLTPEEFEQMVKVLRDSGLGVWHDVCQQRTDAGELAILVGLREFREHLGGALTITLPDGIGRRIEVHHVDPGTVEKALVALRKIHRGS